MKKFATLLCVLLSGNSFAAPVQVPGFPAIPETYITIDEEKSTFREYCRGVNVLSCGYNLVGVFHTPTTPMPKGGYPTVIFFHGFRGNSFGSDGVYRELAYLLTSNGIAVARFDMAGCGNSEGFQDQIPVQTYLKNGEDILAAVSQYSEVNPHRIGIAGVSIGCHTTIHLASTYKPNNYSIQAISVWAPVADGIILLKEICATIGLSTLADSSASESVGSAFGFKDLPIRLCREDISFFLGIQDHVLVLSLPRRIPILHQQGTEDCVVSMAHHRLFLGSAPAQMRFRTYTGTQHDIATSPHRQQILHDIFTHFKKHL
ncbi:alpha/beta hydrolase [Chlamydia sp.]|uniref:alpha/beta hydrolase n=1 Tax=Chlamydia sp. TaxID=35827 RepID=UPI0025BD5FDD|nr:alpha/beta hydrolase [Chlamydia sp.]MBQ8498197.1 alpha/beta hydrolase [Chlamydia sp.]